MRVGIVGLGLIGGSLGLALRSRSAARTDSTRNYTILGVSRRSQVCQQAIAIGAADEASVNFDCLATADVVILCTPIAAIEPTVRSLLPHLKSTTVLTDVGSVKASIVETIAPLWPNFVGGHPMAGKAESGLDVAEADLFVQKPYVLTPIDSTPPEAIAIVTEIAKAVGAIVYECEPEAHDRAVAWISHLPVMVSASLIRACLSEPDATIQNLAQKLASSGFRDASRVGGGVPELGVMMACYNQAALRQALLIYRDRLDEMIDCVDRADWDAIEALLTETQAARPRFLQED
ncbi:prephenate/arogenate dehydrogenase [Microcoleus sp. FACHB-1515]|uniref:prephenate/arogenate dehydrogenase n=1 Tax=Cyanophyceae TaxID=3028117 RepID=UPI0016836487|nr:prephenate/arogenate dehydrogenase [Microcoleus sp. FACHB-1515]MBD2088819.1 prephenate/arogenate dehydrogenase [Microcoleus sp. FACHB-1515]